MSNSSYAKVSDAARFRYLLELIGPAFGEGIWSPLAATSWSFYKEIPIGAPYEIDCHIVSWDEKWVRWNGIQIAFARETTTRVFSPDLLRDPLHNRSEERIEGAHPELCRLQQVVLQTPGFTPLDSARARPLLFRRRTGPLELGTDGPPSQGAQGSEVVALRSGSLCAKAREMDER